MILHNCKINQNFKKQNKNILEKDNFKEIRDYFKDINNLQSFLYDSKDIDKKSQEFIENFEILKYINYGGCGVVFEGCIKNKNNCSNNFKDTNNNKHVALKFIMSNINEKNNAKKSKMKSRILKELNLQKKMKHKNIISVFGYYEFLNCSCLVLDYAKYGDLDYFKKYLIRKKNLSESFLGYITIQILEGLKFIHQFKIIHMDIKPQNILFDENLIIKISDFSVSQDYPNNISFTESDINNKNNNILTTKTNLPIAGTSLYMSPEILGKIKVGNDELSKVDLYSLGVMIYHLAYEKYPYNLNYVNKDDFDEIFIKIKKNNLEFPPRKNYSLLFKNFLKSILNKNIKFRYNIDEAFNDPWIIGAKIIEKQKDKIYDLEKFLIDLCTDNVKQFNDYLLSFQGGYNNKQENLFSTCSSSFYSNI